MVCLNLHKIDFKDKNNPFLIGIGISNKHLHLSQADLETLFGEGYQLREKSALSQPGQFAAKETVTIAGPKGAVDNVRILGPVRKETQVELAQTDARRLGIEAPVRLSGDLADSADCVLIGPKGIVNARSKVIIPIPHIHLSDQQAQEMGIKDQDLVDVYFKSKTKSGALFNIVCRVGQGHEKDLHMDTDEANAFQLKNSDFALIVKHD
ncbi:MAG: phosphate propanoyltransferase [Clostridia bacterium]|nr:phosphate propanoyltransferase [Clostridia bacterium]MDD4798174.1 phosphate propanoyltransferase [Clostridia bacterium]